MYRYWKTAFSLIESLVLQWKKWNWWEIQGRSHSDSYRVCTFQEIVSASFSLTGIDCIFSILLHQKSLMAEMGSAVAVAISPKDHEGWRNGLFSPPKWAEQTPRALMKDCYILHTSQARGKKQLSSMSPSLPMGYFNCCNASAGTSCCGTDSPGDSTISLLNSKYSYLLVLPNFQILENSSARLGIPCLNC